MVTEEYVREWLAKEREYTIAKFGLELDNQHVQDLAVGDDNDKWWEQQFNNYLHRVSILGPDTPAGRQAAAKFVATAIGFLEAIVRVHGPLPKPGVPSGENLDLLGEL
jgi:hypothetical protein